MEMPVEWATSDVEVSSVHLLSYPFLFPPSVLISYFRAINYAAMYKAFETSVEAYNLAHKMTFAHDPAAPGGYGFNTVSMLLRRPTWYWKFDADIY